MRALNLSQKKHVHFDHEHLKINSKSFTRRSNESSGLESKDMTEINSPIVSRCVNDKCCGFTCLRRDIAPAFTLASPGERHLESAWTVVSVLPGSQVSNFSLS